MRPARVMARVQRPYRVGAWYDKPLRWARDQAAEQVAKPIKEEARKAGETEARRVTGQVVLVGGIALAATVFTALLMRGRR